MIPVPLQGMLRAAGAQAYVVLAVLFLGALAGCDAIVEESDPVILPEKVVTFRFVHTAGQSDPASLRLSSVGTADLGDALRADGFLKDEVVSVFVTAVELERIQPTRVKLADIARSASVSLSGASDAQVATLGTVPSASDADMNVDGNREVGDIIRASAPFRGILTIAPADLEPGEQYILEAEVRFRVTVAGV